MNMEKISWRTVGHEQSWEDLQVEQADYQLLTSLYPLEPMTPEDVEQFITFS